ncbi:hypothetical protein E1A91_D07G230500v1 [Gossypium mustelinum]|uniref:TNase-like domain-containing protein n=1 Tax=Gossypium mustelinum TaxID=34275 RepID=A0A5D2UDM2_GOSMU|nr:hypothetical protein E1A91_D07G230500v1 [Gossypium mustelinum]
MGLLATNKVRDGSTVRVYLLPDFQFVQVFVTGIQSPSMGRRAVAETVVETDLTSDDQNGDASTKPWAALTSVQKLFASAPAAAEVSYDPFRIEAKHFTEVRYLNRDVRIVLEGVDKFSNLIGSVYYHKCETGKDLVLELVENIVNTPRGGVQSSNDRFELVPYSQLRSIDASLSATPGLAQLCSLAFLKVPSLDDEFGTKAAQFLSEQTLGSLLQFKAVKEEKDTSWGKVKGQGTGTCLVVTLFTEDPDDSINDAMLKDSLARLEKRKKWELKERKLMLNNLEEC